MYAASSFLEAPPLAMEGDESFYRTCFQYLHMLVRCRFFSEASPLAMEGDENETAAYYNEYRVY